MDSHRVAPLHVPSATETSVGFETLPDETTGITFVNRLSDRQVAENRIRENGSGTALGDIDGDGWTDIYFCALDGSNKLYRNQGDWTFTDITESAGVACAGQFSTGAALADLDGDGDMDLIVTGLGVGARIFHNDGKGHFTPDTQSNLIPQFGATSIAIADINNDGDLDFYLTNYRTTTIKDGVDKVEAQIKRVNGKIVVTPEERFEGREIPGAGITVIERGEPDVLYVNRGGGQFIPVPWQSGAFISPQRKPLAGAPRDWGLSALFADLNNDQHPELYTCNDFQFSTDKAYFSRGGKQFQQFTPFTLRSVSLSSMAADIADIDRDGDQDLFVVEMLSRSPALRQRQRANAKSLRSVRPPTHDPEYVPEVLRNTLFLNRDDNTFAEIAYHAGLAATEWSWGVAFIDVDLDGWDDCLVTNGNYHDVLDADGLNRLEKTRESGDLDQGLANLQTMPRLERPNLAFRNLGNLRFQEIGQEWGFAENGISHGFALGDLDNDGDLDVVVNHLNQPAGIYRNRATAPRISVRLSGANGNTHGIGAKIELATKNLPQTQIMMAGGRYLSSDDPIQSFAAAELENATLTVTWRNGRQTIVEALKPNHAYEVHHEPETTQPAPKRKPRPRPLFQYDRKSPPSRHLDIATNEFERQPLLSRGYGRLGPALAWFDTNGDHWDDLIIGTGRGGRLALFENQQGNGFRENTQAPMTASVNRDLTAVLGWHSGPGQPVLLTGVSHYEDGIARGVSTYEYDLKAKERREGLPIDASSAGPLALADIDQDGDLDLFVGGRVIPSQYPTPASSRLFTRTENAWAPHADTEKQFANLGLVSSACFADLNSDTWPDLILGLEWGPIRVFLNREGRFEDATESMGFLPYQGWWNGIATGDFNNDGALDLVATNWGQNTRYESVRERPLEIRYGAIGTGGQTVGIESFVESGTGRNRPWVDWDQIGLALPEVKRRFPTYRAYAEGTTDRILAPYRTRLKTLSANTLESMIFLNEGDTFRAVPLPRSAQLAPAFGVGVADFNGDGHHDVALAQNFFDVEPTRSRYDAGRGLILLGNGQGEFRELTGRESGLILYGEQRALAIADYNQDARPDLAISENHGPIRLFTNARGRPGLRVRLEGPPENPAAIGAQLRLGDSKPTGPVWEIQSASGYWSQNSAQVVLNGGIRERVWVRWPDGKETNQLVPIGASSISLTAPTAEQP